MIEDVRMAAKAKQNKTQTQDVITIFVDGKCKQFRSVWQQFTFTFDTGTRSQLT